MSWINESRLPGTLEPHQREQILAATQSRIGCLVGGPGTGKTFSMGAIAKAIPVREAVFCAPTGKAAVRMTEALRDANVFAEATTIHRMLKPENTGYGECGGWSFSHNASNPIPANYVLVDESSMIDTALMSSLLWAVDPGAKILFFGDPDQLLPVAHGRPVIDFINSGKVPIGRLTEIHRFAGRIARVCKSIRDDEDWEPSVRIDTEKTPPENVKFIDRISDREKGAALLGVLDRLKERGLDLMQDVQVICSRNTAGRMSRKILNERMQAVLNKGGKAVNGVKYRVGDKAICLSNQSIPVVRRGRNGKWFKTEDARYIANGEIGIVADVMEKQFVVNFDGDLVLIPGTGREDFDLAYAITGHKAQGSQWQVVIIFVDDGSMVAGKNWWYTSISRASLMTIVIGSMAECKRQCRDVRQANRKTFLAEQLQMRL